MNSGFSKVFRGLVPSEDVPHTTKPLSDFQIIFGTSGFSPAKYTSAEPPTSTNATEKRPERDPLANAKAICEGLAKDEKPACQDEVGIPLADFADPLPDEENPAALFVGGYLRKGGGAALVAPAGIGKSSFSIQASILWAMGKSAFGIKPVRRLNIAIIQAEDDPEEVAHMRNEVRRGLLADSYDERCIDEAMKKILVYDFTGLVGERFCDKLKTLLDEHPEIDLVIINPLQSYAGCDISKNADLTKFLRTEIDPIIKPSRAAVLFIHHTNKPPSAKDRGGWGTDMFAAYAGAGGAELANWVRAQLTLIPIEGLSGVFALTAGKRGRRLGWKDPSGAPTTQRYIAHSEGLIYWREATPEEASQASGTGKAHPRKEYDPANGAAALLEILRQAGKPIPSELLLDDLMGKCEIGEAAARRVIRRALEDGAISEVVDKGPPCRKLKGTPEQIEEHKRPKLGL